jgi:hypothetical protein
MMLSDKQMEKLVPLQQLIFNAPEIEAGLVWVSKPTTENQRFIWGNEVRVATSKKLAESGHYQWIHRRYLITFSSEEWEKVKPLEVQNV